MQNRVVEAKEELERALSHQPRDSQSQDLLAGVYFRLGVYPTAIRIWRALADEFPDDPVLHVNLGLSLFKTGQPEDARTHLEMALAIDAEHERAWSYLGLVHWRLGKLDLAREAFLRGGQLTMAHRMEEASSAGAVSAPREPQADEERPQRLEDIEVSAMRDAASEAAKRLSTAGVELALAPSRARRPTGQWSVVETGADPTPKRRVRRPSQQMIALQPPQLNTVIQSWVVELQDDCPLAIGAEGELLIQSKGAVHSRLRPLRAVRGALVTETVDRRYRGRTTEEALGGDDDPIVRWTGPIAAIVGPVADRTYHTLRVDGSLLYVREELVQAFDDRIEFESGRLPLAGEPVVLLSFHGEGSVVLRLPRRPSGLEVHEDEEVRVDPRALVGWTGRLFPSEATDSPLGGVSLAFRGQGILLVT